MQKPGRNDPCPCGSGQKYKKCCLAKQATSPVDVANATWLRMRRTEGELEELLTRHMLDYYGDTAFAQAWDEFSNWDDVPLDVEQYPEIETVLPQWVMYSWVPDIAELDEDESMPEMSIAEHYLEIQGSRASAFTRRFIQTAVAEPFSYWQVLACVPGASMTLRDLLRGGDTKVYERTASHNLIAGTVIYSRVISMNGDSIMLGMAPIGLPPNCAQDLIDYRQRLAEAGHPDLSRKKGEAQFLSDDLLFEYDIELRSYYWQVRQSIMNPTPPVLQNTDGELLVPTTLFYTLSCTVAEAFEALASLSLSDKATLLELGTFDEQGILTAIEFPWQKAGNPQNDGWSNTVLGEITISGEDLAIEVNSKERATSIKRRVAQRLRGRAELTNEENESAQDMIARQQADQHPQTLKRRQQTANESEALMAPLEVQAQLRRIGQQHWHNWLDTELPALKGQTPRQAAASPVGRERLEALLTDFEGKASGDPFMDPDVGQLRRTLGLD